MSQRVAFTSAVLFLITVTTAATGYLRELVLARTFGTGTEMDAFYFTWGLIQATHDLLFGATLTATIVPLLHRRVSGEPEIAGNPASFNLTAAFVVGFSATAVAMALQRVLPYLLAVLAPKMPDVVQQQCLALGALLVWLLPLNALISVCVLVLNAHRRFILAGSVYLLINIVFIIVLLALESAVGVNGLSIASLAGPAVALPILGASLIRLGLLRPVWPTMKFFSPFWRQARPILLTGGIGSSLGLLMVAHFIIRTYAASRGEGSIAALGYAFRLYEVPLSLIANPAAVLIFPSIAIMYKTGSIADIRKVSRETLLGGLVVLLPVAVVTWIGADLVVRLLLAHGNFGTEATKLTADALRGFAPAIVGEGIIIVFYRLFYAIHQPGRTVIASLAALVALIVLLQMFGEVDFIAVPLALSGGFLVGAMVLIFFLVREFGTGSMPGSMMIAKWAICVAVAVAAWKFTDLYWGYTAWSALTTALVFTLIYGAAVQFVFHQYRRFSIALIGSFVSRLRQV